MTPTNNLDLQGNFLTFPLAELLVEIAEATLDGSLRLSHENQKVVVYFNAGEVVFAVSNERSSRLFDVLLRENKIDKKTLVQIPNFTGDMELAKVLMEKNLFSGEQINALFENQIEEILRNALGWKSGEWIFSPLARIKENIQFKVNIRELLSDYARKLSNEAVYHRFKSMQETFTAKEITSASVNIQTHEAFILSRFAGSKLSIEEIKQLGGLPEAVIFQTLYALWLGGFLLRQNWNAAFTEQKIATIRAAKIQLKKQETAPPVVAARKETAPKTEEKVLEIPTEEATEEISLENYLKQVENSITHYETLNVPVKAEVSEIKKAYFTFAKRFHPDHFHQETNAALHTRIQTAFSRIAQAYDILKTSEIRDSYDFKMRKELAQREKMQDATAAEFNKQQQTDIAGENFEQGFNHLMEEEYAEAYPFLARAAHLAPDTARYRAYFGKVLSGDSSQRHKAEGELQAAIKLEPENPTFRIMLVEFFIQYNLLKRAEGELGRLLTISPDNKEAKNLLDSLANK